MVLDLKCFVPLLAMLSQLEFIKGEERAYYKWPSVKNIYPVRLRNPKWVFNQLLWGTYSILSCLLSRYLVYSWWFNVVTKNYLADGKQVRIVPSSHSLSWVLPSSGYFLVTESVLHYEKLLATKHGFIIPTYIK